MNRKTSKNIEKRRLFRKGQGGEMIGLLVIVILMVVIFAVYIRFASAPESGGEEARVSAANNYLISSMLNSNVCPGKSLEDAIKAWGNNDRVCQQDNMEEFITQESDAMLKAYFGNRYEISGKKPFEMAIKPVSAEKTPIIIGPAGGLKCEKGGIMPSESVPVGRAATMQVKTCVSLQI